MGTYVVILELIGSLIKGCQVRVEVQLQDAQSMKKTLFVARGVLPPHETLSHTQQTWRNQNQVLMMRSRLGSNGKLPHQLYDHQSMGELRKEIAEQLETQLNQWLDQGWLEIGNKKIPLGKRLIEHLPNDSCQEVQFFLSTDSNELPYLPWHRWHFVSEHPAQPEVALCPTHWERSLSLKPRRRTGKIRVLAIFGDRGSSSSQPLNIDFDKTQWHKLSAQGDIELITCDNPTPKQLCDYLQDERGWDIFFFAGHSSTDATGKKGVFYVQIDQSGELQRSLSLRDFQQSLKQAIDRGLQLAIFNACQGLGVVQPLVELNMPCMIVMREVIPDVIAQDFLQSFLQHYSRKHKSLHQSVQAARVSLEPYDSEDYPTASWLPVICQSPGNTPPTWDLLRGRYRLPALSYIRLMGTSLAIASLIMGMRYLGALEPWELWSYDRIMRLQPAKKVDPHLTIITIDQEDIEYQQKLGMTLRGDSLSDRALQEVLDRLIQHNPAIIGLDIYRDFPAAPEMKSLRKQLGDPEFPLVAICRDPDDKNQNRPMNPPPELKHKPYQLGVSDFLFDSDRVIRRQLLGLAESKEKCPTQSSFSFQLANHFLGLDKSFSQDNQFMKLGNTQFKILENHQAAYHSLHQLHERGFQHLVQYRANQKPFEEKSLRSILDNKTPNDELARLIENRVILIGVIDNEEDQFLIPISDEKFPGVMIHAHLIHHLISAAKGESHLLKVLPLWGDFLWVFAWAIASAMTTNNLPYARRIIGSQILLSIMCSVSYFGLFSYYQIWVPFVPTSIVIILTSSSLWIQSSLKAR
jgi:CHASE2 domain-containing sensor protein